jgi:hypothetical protein
MFGQITANDLKIKGISAIDELVFDNDGVIITVRGKEKIHRSFDSKNTINFENSNSMQQYRKPEEMFKKENIIPARSPNI